MKKKVRRLEILIILIMKIINSTPLMNEIRDKQRRKIIEEINSYLIEIENNEDGDARVLHLLNAIREALEEEKEGGKEKREGINTI